MKVKKSKHEVAIEKQTGKTKEEIREEVKRRNNFFKPKQK